MRAFFRLLVLGALALAFADEPTPTTPQEEIDEAREEFEAIDSNKDGFVTREEILEMEEVPEREEVDEFFNTYDRNGDGRVEFEEILAADAELRKEAEDEEGQSKEL